MTIGEKIKLFAINKYNSVYNLADIMGIKAQSLYTYINNKSTPGGDILKKLYQAGCDINWLLSDSESEEALGIKKSEAIEVPILDVKVAAGINGIYNNDYPSEIATISLPLNYLSKNKKYYGLQVKGESMEPTLMDGSLIVVSEIMPLQAKNNNIYVIVTREGEAHIKRILIYNDYIVCLSDNYNKDLYPDYEIPIENIHKIYNIEMYITNKLYKNNDRIDKLEKELYEIKKLLKNQNPAYKPHED